MKRKPWGYWCHSFKDLPKSKHKWRFGCYPGDKKYVCSNCGLQRNSIKGLSNKE